MSVDVTDGFAEQWWPEQADTLHADRNWLRHNVFRPGPNPITLRVGTAVVLCYANLEPAHGEAYDLVRLLLGDPPVFEWTRAGLGELRALRARAPELSAALCPNVTVVLPGYRVGYVSGGPSTAEQAAAAVRGVLRLATDRGIGTSAFLYVPRDDGPLPAALRDAGFRRVALTSRAVLPVGWSDLDGYAAWLAKQSRKTVRKDLRRMGELGVMSGLGDPRRDLDTVARLRCRHLRGFGLNPDEAAERARFGAIVDAFAEHVWLVLTWRNGKPIGCSLFIRRGRVVDSTLTATDPEAGRCYAQFDHSVYAPTRLGVVRSGDLLDLGISHLDYKLVRGATPVPLDAWVRVAGLAEDAALGELATLAATANQEAPSGVAPEVLP